MYLDNNFITVLYFYVWDFAIATYDFSNSMAMDVLIVQ